MEPKKIKRKYFEVVKNDLGVELTKLTSDSDKLNRDLATTNEDFKMMCKSMTDRQADFLTRGLFLEKQYGKVINALDGREQRDEVGPVRENELVPASYAGNIQSFAKESRESLIHQRITKEVQIQDMESMFQRYEDVWKQNMKELRERAEQIEKKRRSLSGKLFEFSKYVIEDSSSGL